MTVQCGIGEFTHEFFDRSSDVGGNVAINSIKLIKGFLQRGELRAHKCGGHECLVAIEPRARPDLRKKEEKQASRKIN